MGTRTGTREEVEVVAAVVPAEQVVAVEGGAHSTRVEHAIHPGTLPRSCPL